MIFITDNRAIYESKGTVEPGEMKRYKNGTTYRKKVAFHQYHLVFE